MAPRRRRRNQEDDTMVERGCLKCCEACRCKPITCCLIFSVAGLVAATVLLWLAAASLQGISPKVDRCEAVLPANGINFSFDEYFGWAGILVVCLLAGIISCGFVAFGCSTSSLPSAVRVIAGFCVIIPIFALLFYLGWVAFGTVMIIYCPLFPNAIVYVAVLYVYGLIMLLCGTIAFIIAVTKLGKAADQKISAALKN